jgi:hypothetical protein
LQRLLGRAGREGGRMDLRRVVIEPAQGAQRRADLVLDPAASSAGAAFSCSKENVKLVMAPAS